MEERRHRSVTRADVARLAGVSTAVVSYTLNGGPKAVAPETAERVRDAVEKLGYRPNPSARSLSKGSMDVIGVVLPDVGNPFFAALAQAIERQARARGCDLLMYNTMDDPSEVAGFLQHLDGMRVRGVLLTCDVQDPQLGMLYGIRTRVVQMDVEKPPPGIVSVLADLYAGAKLAVEHLIGKGHREIAFLGSDAAGDARRRGWEDAHREAGLTPGPAFYAPFSRDGGYAAMQEMLSAASHPGAVFTSSDMIGVGALRAIHEADLRVPEDIAVVSFDDSPEAAFSTPGLTTVRQPIEEMAGQALSALLDADFLEPGAHLHPVSLVVRASSG